MLARPLFARPRRTRRHEGRQVTALGTVADTGRQKVRAAADWLPLVATPAFGAMALWSGQTGGEATVVCSATGVSPLDGMAAMYLLMSVIHVAPWLKLLAEPRERSEQQP